MTDSANPAALHIEDANGNALSLGYSMQGELSLWPERGPAVHINDEDAETIRDYLDNHLSTLGPGSISIDRKGPR